MRLTLISLTLAATLTACGGSGLDVSGRGDPARLLYAEVGTEITLQNTINGTTSQTEITALRPAGAQGRFRAADGVEGSFYPGCWDCGAPNVVDDAIYASLWPLETGKQVSLLRTAPDGQKARVVIRVAGIQDVETPVGTLETYLLDGRIEHLTGPRYSAQVRAWWAPGPGWVVKAEGGDSKGATLSSQMIGYKRP
ncbi:MAG: hypothetical protein AAF674_08545 [Pseudomonadota bacterium]